MHRAALAVRRRFPGLASRVARAMPTVTATKREVDDRLAAARRVFNEVDLFVAPSRSIADEFQRLGVDAAKIRTSDYGFVPLLRSIRNGNDGTRRPLRIGYVGTLVWHKGVHVLLDAVRGIPLNAYELKIFGNPDVFPDYSAALLGGAAGLPVRFMGAFDRERVAEVYAQIDVLVVPSLWLENSPLVIHEAFMAGIPVVGARIGGIVDLVDEGRTGLLYDPASPIELQAVLRTLIENPQRLNALAEFARTMPRVKSIVEDAQEWERAYAEVLRGRPAVGLAT
jgi:glycosyltransferase involved in cell wall biosynthesis